MTVTIEDLSNQIIELMGSLPPEQPFYSQLNIANDNYWQHSNQNDQCHYLAQLYAVLNSAEGLQEIARRKKTKLLEELNKTILLLMRDWIITSVPVPVASPPQAKTKKPTFFEKSLFIGIALLSMFIAAVDSASVVQSLLSSITSISQLSQLVLVPAQISFIGVAVLTFYVLELHHTAKTLGIGIFQVDKTFKLYAEQALLFKQSFELIQAALSESDLSNHNLQFIKAHYANMTAMYQTFSAKIVEAHGNQAPTFRKKLVQNVALALCASACGIIGALAAQALVPPLLPVIIGSAAAAGPIGLAITAGFMCLCFVVAASLFISNERKSVRNFVSEIWGMPTKIIQHINKKQEKIKTLQRTISNLISSKARWLEIQEENYELTNTLMKIKTHSAVDVEKSSTDNPAFNSPERRQQAVKTLPTIFPPSQQDLPLTPSNPILHTSRDNTVVAH